jgi:hypothetical protein
MVVLASIAIGLITTVSMRKEAGDQICSGYSVASLGLRSPFHLVAQDSTVPL